MRLADVILSIATAGSFVAAQPHRHHHRHDHKRSPNTEIVTVPETVYAFEFNGQSMTQAQVCKGIADGTLEWAPGTEDPPACDANTAPSSSSVAPPTTTSSPVPSATGNELFQASSSSTTASSSSPAPAATTSPAAAVEQVSSSSGSGQYDTAISSNPNVNKDFPDGQLDCSTFPQDYGAIPVAWMGLGGWSGIQLVTISGSAVTSIVTGVNGTQCQNTADGTAMCSYACPPGYQKSQWPTTQGSTGQSVGGLMCGSDNKLHITNSDYSKLCIQGSGLVEVQNNLGGNVAICRTDYPGTEDESVPLDTQAGTTSPLTCPKASNYYKWNGAFTSAQYYVNNMTVPVEQACQWSTNGTDIGNFAPVNFGVGTDQNGDTWLSILSTQQQNPANYGSLNFNAQLKGDFGGDSTCFVTVQDGTAYYCSQGSPSNFDKSNCETYKKCEGNETPPACNPAPGCTVQLMSGTATYVLS